MNIENLIKFKKISLKKHPKLYMELPIKNHDELTLEELKKFYEKSIKLHPQLILEMNDIMK